VERQSALADVSSADRVWRVAVDETVCCAFDTVHPLPPGECLYALPEVVARALPDSRSSIARVAIRLRWN
jgi:hypothetical protein